MTGYQYTENDDLISTYSPTHSVHLSREEYEAKIRADERDKILALTIKLINLYGDPRCGNLHHSKKHRHTSLDCCPVEAEINKLRQQIKEMR